jgi:hypothetical protein
MSSLEWAIVITFGVVLASLLLSALLEWWLLRGTEVGIDDEEQA